jgi:hypothetical protein
MGRYRPHIKVRGGKRHLQRHQRQSITPTPLDIQNLYKRHYDYEYLGLAPWHRHAWNRQQTPKLIRQLAVQHLLATFFAWHSQLAEFPEPYFLAIRIVAPEFAHSSEVMVAIKDQFERYQTNYDAPDTTGPSLPEVYQKLPGAEKLTWHAQPWEVFVDAFDYPNGWPAWALRKPNYLWQSPDGCEYLVMQTGWMWVGQMPTETV